MKRLMLIGIALLGFISQSMAGDLYVIGNRDTLVTASRQDLEILMGLNARHMRQAVRVFYHQLEVENMLFNIQPGTIVNVTFYFDDGIVKIEWNNGLSRGFVNKDDLAVYLGNPNKVGIWDNNN